MPKGCPPTQIIEELPFQKLCLKSLRKICKKLITGNLQNIELKIVRNLTQSFQDSIYLCSQNYLVVLEPDLKKNKNEVP